MKNRRVWLLISALAVLTAILAAIHFATRDAVPEGTLKIETSTLTLEVTLSDLELTEVKGSAVNGKGEEKAIDAQGILLSNLLEQLQISGFERVTAEADDAYSASVSAAEIAAPNKVYLITQEDSGVQLMVFGDSNSKRHVSGVVCLKIQ